MSPEVIAAVTGLAVGLIPAILMFVESRRKTPAEIAGLHAEASADNAAASKTQADAAGQWIENYNRMFQLVQERDIEIVSLNRRLLDIESRALVRDREIEGEIEKRIAAEKEVERLVKLVAELTQKVEELQALLKTVQQENSHNV